MLRQLALIGYAVMSVFFATATTAQTEFATREEAKALLEKAVAGAATG